MPLPRWGGGAFLSKVTWPDPIVSIRLHISLLLLDFTVILCAMWDMYTAFWTTHILPPSSCRLGFHITVDFVAIVMPPDTVMKYGATPVKAYAYPNAKRSVYRWNRASEVSVQVHEFGHTNGLSHSGKGIDVYGDRYVPRICFECAL